MANTLSSLSSIVSSATGSTQNSAAASNLSKVWNSMNTLNSAASSLDTNNLTKVFNQKAVKSTDAKNITATAANGATPTTYTVSIITTICGGTAEVHDSVKQLASAQQNMGTTLQAGGTTLSAQYANQPTTINFATNNGKTTTPITVNVKQGDTNDAVLNNLATLINAANNKPGLGVTAQVLNGIDAQGNKTSTLALTAAKTGTSSAFSVSGNLAGSAGMNNTLVVAKNASYTVNGGAAVSSQDNTPTLDNGNVTLNLKGVTNNATLKVGTDANSIDKQLRSFIKQYNSTVQTLNQNSTLISSSIVSRLEKFAKQNGSDLASIGITVNSDKTLTLNDSRFQQSLTDGSAASANRLVSGLVGNAASTAKSVTTSPMTSMLNSSSGISIGDSTQNYLNSLNIMQQYKVNSNSNLLNLLMNPSGNLLNIGA